MRLAYADPPYLGCAWRYPEHPDAARWDNPGEHESLMLRLDREYDGWAYSLISTTLQELLPLAPVGVRVGAWVKPFAVFKPGVRVAYTWEPVIFREARTKSDRDLPTIRDYLATPVALMRGLPGAKPEPFCRWILDLLGYAEGDTFDDLFPGTGVMGSTIAQGVLL